MNHVSSRSAARFGGVPRPGGWAAGRLGDLLGDLLGSWGLECSQPSDKRTLGWVATMDCLVAPLHTQSCWRSFAGHTAFETLRWVFGESPVLNAAGGRPRLVGEFTTVESENREGLG